LRTHQAEIGFCAENKTTAINQTDPPPDYDQRARVIQRPLENFLPMPTLLVIDDQQPVLAVLEHALTAQGFTVVVAENGAAGLALFDRLVIDGALVDFLMPGLDGVAICRELRARAQQTGHDLPVWLITGACTPELRREAVAAGVVAVLMKPFNFAELGRELKKRLGGTPTPQTT
jgi:two-component system response regulator PrrA